MKQYAIKPLVFIEDRTLYLSSENFGRDFWIRPSGGVFLLEVNIHSNTYTRVYAGEHQTIEAAKAHAQQLWEDYLKQYLEEIKTGVPYGALELLEEAMDQISLDQEQIESEWGYNRDAYQLDKAGEMPEVYYKIKKYREEVK